MTNTRRWVLIALAAVLLMASSPVSAHGAPAQREIDTRVLVDDDGGLGYGACIEVCNPALPPEGLDVLALDVREAYLAGQPALVFRITAQSEAVHDGRALVLQVMKGTEVSTFKADNGDGTTYVSADFDRLDGPFDVGDGHPKAIDGWVWLSTLGLQAGDKLDGITVTSTHHDEPDDVMPGTWYFQGQAVPHLPHDADPGEAIATPASGTYTLLGPAPLLTFAADRLVADLANGSANVTLTVQNPLTTLSQFANLTVTAPGGLEATLDAASLNLEPGASRQVVLAVRNSSAHGHGHSTVGEVGQVTVAVTSDLGFLRMLDIAVALPAQPANATTPAHGDHGEHGNDDPAEQTPAASPVVALAAFALALATVRRRA